MSAGPKQWNQQVSKDRRENVDKEEGERELTAYLHDEDLSSEVVLTWSTKQNNDLSNIVIKLTKLCGWDVC